MLKNYLKISWRNLMKNKVFSFINIFGLTVGLTSFLLIALYVFDELTYDRFHKNANNIYRVIETQTTPEGKETKYAAAPYQLGEKAKSDLPEVKDVARISAPGRANISTLENTNTFYEDFWIANPGFLRIFDFQLLQGDRQSALSAPHSVIVTEETAVRLFGTTNVMGKAIKADRDSLPCTITGVLKNFPVNSHLSFNLCFSEASMADPGFQRYLTSDWASSFFSTYVLTDGKPNLASTASKLTTLVRTNQKEQLAGTRIFSLQSLKDVHFYSNGIEQNIGKTGNLTYIYVFSIIGFFVLLIASINYMNLTTARFANRAKEVAVRKVAGATRNNLTYQFFAEAFLVTAIALVFALILIKLLLPYFNAFTEKQLTLGFGTDYRIWAGIGIIVSVVGLLSGIYPALFQSGFKPIVLLKNNVNPGKGNLSLRRSLVVFQFALSIIMIVATMVVYMQMRYVNEKDMGFNNKQLVVIDINSGKIRRSAETIKTEFAKLSYVSEVSVSSRVPGEWKSIPRVKVKNENIAATDGSDMFFFGADEQFLATYQIQLTNGRNFLKGAADSNSIIINETAAKQLGIKEAAGQLVTIPQVPGFGARIIGIVKDFNFQSLREPVASVVIGFQKNPIQNIDYFTARVEAGNASETLAQMESIIHSIDQDHLFEYHFLDKQWQLFYREDKLRQSIFMIVALLTIIIACLGLFGLATYSAEQRIKEIGIRKVLGASVVSIVSMLSKDFLKLVLMAALLAFPIAWWAMNNWLQDFAYHINISWWIFVLAGGVAVSIAVLTISFQAIKAAIRNPVKSLRSE